MRIQETLNQINGLQHLIGTSIPGTNHIIDDIIPAPDNNQLDDYITKYLKTESLSTAIQSLNTKDFEILLLSNSKKRDIFHIIDKISNFWYKEYY